MRFNVILIIHIILFIIKEWTSNTSRRVNRHAFNTMVIRKGKSDNEMIKKEKEKRKR